MTEDIIGMGYYTPEETESVVDFQRLQKEFMELTKQEPSPETYIKLIAEEFEEWDYESSLANREFRKYFRQEYSPEAELKELTDLLYVIFGYANSKGWDMAEAYKRVDANNKGRCVQPDGTVNFNEQGKVLKNKDYPKVRLGDLV